MADVLYRFINNRQEIEIEAISEKARKYFAENYGFAVCGFTFLEIAASEYLPVMKKAGLTIQYKI